MPGLLLRLLICALGLWLAAALLPGMHISSPGTLLLAALLLGVVNAVVRPVLILLTLPITVLTLGLFLLVINAATLGLVAALLDGFAIAGFFTALFGALIVSVTGWIASWYIGPSGRIEVLVVKRSIDRRP
ncbi:MAG TPA: phage holin family protein [Gammaproteobacteria bacterium]